MEMVMPTNFNLIQEMKINSALKRGRQGNSIRGNLFFR